MQEVKLSIEQIQAVMNQLQEIPLKFSLGLFNFFQTVAQEQLQALQPKGPVEPPQQAE